MNRWILGAGCACAAGVLHCLAAPGIPFKVPPGFEVQSVYRIPQSQGSWVAMTVDPKGRLLTSDQFGPLYRVTLPTPTDAAVRAEPLPVDLGGAQGLLWAFDSLYVVANRPADKGGSGLYRLRDLDGDDRFDEVRLLRRFAGDGEHGPHAVLLGPDQRSLWVLAGNATTLPEPETSAVPRRWAEDMPLPHLGQTDGVWRTNRPGGWICRLDPDGRQVELHAVGVRNPYDLAFNADGELFTFDADMEWDVGTPWYRPTRVLHVTRGAEFGWRTGSSKWPDYYADSLPAVLDVGESSPTGLAFGDDARFPARYQRALFLGDWSYGKIFAVHLEPAGASYRATLETFLTGAPLPVTDLVIRPQDGALYFLTGGRGTPSTLFRVAYTGAESTARVDPRQPDPDGLRALRRKLEAFHSHLVPDAVQVAWPHLGHADRTIRFAARVAVEHQPLATWRARALAETEPRARLNALLALSRCGTPDLLPAVVQALAALQWTALDLHDRLDWIRVATVAALRLGPLDAPSRQQLIDVLNPRFPSGQYDLDRELSQLLVHLDAPGIVDRALAAMESAASQEEQLHYALCLRTRDLNAWSAPQRERYFSWFAQALGAGGGVTYSEYLHSIRSQAIDRLTADHHEALRPILSRKPPEEPSFAEFAQRTVAREWAVEALLPRLQAGSTPRDLDRGRRVYAAAMCIKCHRFNRQGGLTGPDLTGVGQRFDDRTLLESILEPSKVVSDQYATVEVNTREGESFVGRIGDQNDQEILLKSDLLNPANIRRIRWADIESVVPSTASLMPPGLLGPFTEAEILDLVAFLKAPGAPATAKPLREPDVIYVPTPQSVVDQMIAMAELKPGDVLYDLGCGDGRIVVTAARRHGIRAVGVDIHPDRVRDSLANVRSNRVDHLVTILQADLFTLDFSDATVVTLYLLPELNVRLMPTLARLKPGTRILSHDFSLGHARPVDVHRSYPQGPDSDDTEHVVYKYLVPWTLNDGVTP